MPGFRSDKASSSLGRSIKKALLIVKDATHDAWPGVGHRASERRKIEKEIAQLKNEFRAAKRRRGQLKNEAGNAKERTENSLQSLQHGREPTKRSGQPSWIDKKVWMGAHRREQIKARGEVFWLEREISRLENELDTPKGRRTTGAPETGALPDFVIIGAQKCGTSSLYHLLTQHPLVERAATKELHFFDSLYEEGIEWYRRCFPRPRQKDGRRTITGEASPVYLYHPFVAERMEKVVPQAKLIALLRNPVDRAYSQYHQRVRKGRETRRGFEEAIEAEMEWLLGKQEEEAEASEYEHLASANINNPDERRGLLARGIYVNQLMRWSRLFSEEQMLVLKSEDFFERPQEALKDVLDFLELPKWEPEGWEVRNKGGYEQEMDPKTRRQLEDFFEPYNKRLYEYLGVDFGW